MARTSINVEEMMKDPSYQKEYENHLKFIRNFVKSFINRCNKESKNQYSLKKDYGISTGTLDALRQNRSITLNTLNDLCKLLECNVEDIIVYYPDEKK